MTIASSGHVIHPAFFLIYCGALFVFEGIACNTILRINGAGS
jgi:hypothetical protein